VSTAQTLPQGWSSLPPGWSTAPPTAPPNAPTPTLPHSGYDTMDRLHNMQGAVDTAAQTEPINLKNGVGGAVESTLNDLGAGAVRATLQPLVHPVQTLKGMGEAAIAPFNPKPFVEQGQNMERQFAANPSGESVAALPQAAMALAGGGKATGNEPLPALGDIVKPRPSPDIVSPAEMASRRLAQTVLPATKDAGNFIAAAPHEVPNILDFAKRSNNPMKTQLEFAKAAQGSAQEARDFYENQILKPNDKLVKTTGTGFGDQSHEGPDTYAKLSDIDKRVVEINKQLDKPTLNVDDARRALASKNGLQAEAAKLRDILHRNLSEATGLSPDDIAAIRQRVGRSYELSNDTLAAVTQRMQGEGRAEQGPLHLSQIPSQILNFARGGPQAIADRSFQRAIRKFPGEAQPLPVLKNIVSR
jgi:hypothetical protein